jgi:transcriptional regulator of met regulon
VRIYCDAALDALTGHAAAKDLADLDRDRHPHLPR